MISKEERFFKTALKNDGHLVVKDFFNESLIARLKMEIIGVFRSQIRRHKARDIFHLFKMNPQAVKNCGKAVQNLPLLWNVASSPQVMDILDAIMGRPIITTKPIVHFHHPDLAENEIAWKTPAHQDIGSVQSSLNAVVLWFPLVNCRDDIIGPLEIVSGSHKLGSQWDHFDSNFAVCSAYDDSDFSKVRLDVGDLLIFNQALVHRSGTNSSRDPRWSITLRYGDLEDENWRDRDFYSPYKNVLTSDPNFSFTEDDIDIALSKDPTRIGY